MAPSAAFFVLVLARASSRAAPETGTASANSTAPHRPSSQMWFRSAARPSLYRQACCTPAGYDPSDPRRGEPHVSELRSWRTIGASPTEGIGEGLPVAAARAKQLHLIRGNDLLWQGARTIEGLERIRAYVSAARRTMN